MENNHWNFTLKIYFKLHVALSLIFFMNSPTYASLFGTQEELNVVVAKAASSSFSLINTNLRYPDETERYSTDSEDWVFKKHKHGIFCLEMKGDVPSECVKSFLQSKSVIDCRLAIEFVRLDCMRQVLGDDVFDKLINKFHIPNHKRVVVGGKTKLCPTRYVGATIHESFYDNPQVGSFGYIANHPSYQMFHQNRTGAGENVVVVGCDDGEFKYLGFGPKYQAGPVSLSIIKEDLKSELLEKPNAGDFTSPEAAAMVRSMLESSFGYQFIQAQKQAGSGIGIFSQKNVNTYIEVYSK